VTRKQLLELGVRRRAVEARLEVGLLFRIHRGVYAVGHIPTAPLDRARGALLAVGVDFALCRKSAAAFWGLYTRWAAPIEVIGPRRHRLSTLSAHRCGTLLERDIRIVDGIRVTCPARTLLDIAPRTATKLLHRFHNELRMRKLIDNDQLIDVAIRNPLHPGAPRLLELAGESKGEAKRSPFESDWQRFAARHDLPAHEINVDVAGKTVDVLFTPDRLVVELDGWDKHGTRYSVEDDRDRDSGILAATGIPTMRITYAGLHRRPAEQVRRINAILSRR
jgi:very-short-patch-repair endonuclease